MIIKDMVISDKAAIDSARTKDENGYLHVAVSNITKEQIAPYMGASIPYWQELNLDPQRVYNIYRPAVEIEKAVDTFNGLPLAYEHHDMDANNVPKEFIIGSLGTDARFESPYLKNSLTIIDAEAIKAVENGACSEISAGYMCDIVMDGGLFNGQSYDGYMTNIRGNHVAIVPQGRAGHDVKVADAAEGGVNVEKNLMAKLKELLVELLKGEEKAEEIKAENPQEMPEKVEEEIKAEALDPVKTDEEIPAEPKEEENPEAKDEEVPAEEAEAKDEETPLEGLTEEIIEMMKNAGLDAEDKNQQKAFLAGLAVDKAKDTCKDSVDADIEKYKAMIKAADEVAPYIGKVNDPLSFKDAADIYAKALVHEGVVIDGVDPSAYSAMVSMLAKKQTQIIEAKADPINETLKSIKSM